MGSTSVLCAARIDSPLLGSVKSWFLAAVSCSRERAEDGHRTENQGAANPAVLQCCLNPAVPTLQ